MLPISCKTVKDIVAIAALVADLVTALSETKGSAAKYRSFFRELEAMRVVLEAVSREAKRCTDVKLRAIIVEEVDHCCNHVREAAQSIAKFTPLGQDPPVGRLNKVRLDRLWYKIEWRAVKQKDIDNFERQLSASRGKLTMYLAIMNSHNARSVSRALSNHVKAAAAAVATRSTAMSRVIGNNTSLLGNWMLHIFIRKLPPAN
ncbi:hypothetical protein K488DRAFT_72403 [Vararia minispora EC-137]|uniref:Uncharacterized protein n=1 Tax=Vararia minispora EC-137 TaxID=1314806 RepID=A0ACB8QFU2_9AGAM|nr:hypothetical protein K488DRAFT_72403 [Vararia minispora EC-137]